MLVFFILFLQPNHSDDTAKPANSTTSSTTTTTTTLNLNMTAAELRRRLAERKKQDSRRAGGAGDGSLDFRKKYEIVDKLWKRNHIVLNLFTHTPHTYIHTYTHF